MATKKEIKKVKPEQPKTEQVKVGVTLNGDETFDKNKYVKVKDSFGNEVLN